MVGIIRKNPNGSGWRRLILPPRSRRQTLAGRSLRRRLAVFRKTAKEPGKRLARTFLFTMSLSNGVRQPQTFLQNSLWVEYDRS